MALSSNLIGKQCYVDMSEDNTIEQDVLGQVISYYKDSSDEYVEVSINPFGKVIRIEDDSKITVISG